MQLTGEESEFKPIYYRFQKHMGTGLRGEEATVGGALPRGVRRRKEP